MKIKLILSGLLCMLFLAVNSKAAVLSTLSGIVTDAKTNQPIAGATISIPQLRVNVISGIDGKFSFTALPSQGKYAIEVKFIGYTSIVQTIDLASPSSLSFALTPSISEIHEVIITGTPIASNNKY